MMNSQENAPKEGMLDVEQQNNTNPAEVEFSNETQAEPKTYKSKAEILERLKEIVGNEENPTKEELDNLKTTFYKIHIAERDAKQKAYLEAGGDPEKYVMVPDEDEEIFKAQMSVIKERRAKLFLEQEAEKQDNLQKKLDIIERIKAMVTSPDEANKCYQEFKELQQQWKEIRTVPADKANELWRNYQLYIEQYYDLLNLNREAREYDFKKNLELKRHLCEAAEKLDEEQDVISAFHQLQELHQQYRETGPVAKELREETWNRFKAASTVINKKHQKHFEDLRSKEEENLSKKTTLCEQIEEIVKAENNGEGDWDKHTKEIIALQADWKKIGFAPQKMNVKIFERFRASCDEFFGKKAEHFKEMKQHFTENAEKKQKMIEQAESLQGNTDWKATTDKFIALQKEWKTIGPVPKKLGDELWTKFLSACNKFFEARNAANAGTRNEEHSNLNKKKDIISQLKALAEDISGDVQEKVQKLVEEYNKIGHVPFKEKDKLYKQFHDLVDKQFDRLNVSATNRKLNNIKTNISNVAGQGEKGSAQTLYREREKLVRAYESMKNEIKTYENNLGFLTSSSKKGNSLVTELNRKVEKLKSDLELTLEKIKVIDQSTK